MNTLPCSAAAERNKQVILDRLCQLLPAQGSALEIASGTGQHVVFFAAALPQWIWQPSDYQTSALPVITARVAQQALANVRAPQQLDVMAQPWLAAGTPAQTARFDLILCANMLHIAPWPTCSALMQGSARHLSPNGVLVTYGPYLEDEVTTAAGNLDFDRSLRAQDPAWGIRRRADVEIEASRARLMLAARHEMPANNLLLVWRAAPKPV